MCYASTNAFKNFTETKKLFTTTTDNFKLYMMPSDCQYYIIIQFGGGPE